MYFIISHCCVYLSSFLLYASYTLSSHGTVSSTRTTFLLLLGQRTASGLSVVVVTSLGNINFFPRSTSSVQSLAVVSKPTSLVLVSFVACGPALTNAISFGLSLPLMDLLAWSIDEASSLSTWSWRHRYLPCCSAMLQLERICSRLALFPHRVHAGSSFFPQSWRFAGVGSKSYTELILIFRVNPVEFHISLKDIFFLVTESHFNHAHCLLIVTIC